MTTSTGKNKIHVQGVDMDADYTPGATDPNGGFIRCEHSGGLILQIEWDAVPLGTFIVEGRVGALASWIPMTLSSDMIHDITADAVLTAAGDIELDGTLAGHVGINMKDPFPEMRVRWDHDFAGSSDTWSCYFGKRH